MHRCNIDGFARPVFNFTEVRTCLLFVLRVIFEKGKRSAGRESKSFLKLVTGCERDKEELWISFNSEKYVVNISFLVFINIAAWGSVYSIFFRFIFFWSFAKKMSATSCLWSSWLTLCFKEEIQIYSFFLMYKYLKKIYLL